MSERWNRFYIPGDLFSYEFFSKLIFIFLQLSISRRCSRYSLWNGPVTFELLVMMYSGTATASDADPKPWRARTAYTQYTWLGNADASAPAQTDTNTPNTISAYGPTRLTLAPDHCDQPMATRYIVAITFSSSSSVKSGRHGGCPSALFCGHQLWCRPMVNAQVLAVL